MILQRRTHLPVEVVTSSTHMQNGHIYVIPSNRHVSIRDHQVEVRDDRGKRPRPSVDTLLSTASEFYGDHLIAVILTGSGSDGAVGAVDVKKCRRNRYCARSANCSLSFYAYGPAANCDRF
jgi:chemotaxis response regulator CheB